jgi:hypothetical protein
MQTVLSHIVQKRLSQESENVATEALAVVLGSYEAAHNGMMKLIRGVDPHMPHLWFRTQQSEGNDRPDMRVVMIKADRMSLSRTSFGPV